MKKLIFMCILVSLIVVPICEGFEITQRVAPHEMLFCFDRYDPEMVWENNYQNMIDGNENTYASTTINGDIQYLISNTCDYDSGRMRYVKIRVNGYSTFGSGETNFIKTYDF